MKTIYEELREERKELQEKELLPMWFTTNGYQMFKEKYLWESDSFRDQVRRVAKTAAKHTGRQSKKWEKKFFNIIWKGWLACSTPVLANMGTTRGCPVSCSGGYVSDSIDGFYSSKLEAALLSKHGFGTSNYLGDIRPRNSPIAAGGKASGVLPVFKGFVQLSRDVTQGGVRRGAWAGYLPIDHADFWEICAYLVNNPDDANIGWCISDQFIDSLNKGTGDSLARYQRALKVKCITGKGYFIFPDKINRLSPNCYKDQNLLVKGSNLCAEIALFSDEDHTFSCVLSSMNLAKYDEWKDSEAVFIATVFLDCVAQEFIEMGSKINHLDKVVRFTYKSRALGLGTLGFHTYLQDHNIAIEDLDAHFKNIEIYKKIHDESLRASQWMAQEWGEPEWCKGYGVRNSHRTAIAPNLSSALICGSVSQGIEPIYENVFTQGSAAGEMNRINPSLLKVMKQRNVYAEETIQSIIKDKGSVRNQSWLSDHEKMVFKTAFEIDQKVLLRLASTRQQYICQSQSLNLFFAADEDEEYISEVHKQAFLDPNIKSLYYLRSLAGVHASKNECVACEG
jgi:ribonucleoside-diphosphate reductase alpha chain